MNTPPKTTYRIRNWKEYDGALKQRGSITFWVDETVIEQWKTTEKTGKRGASNDYTDLAIATIATVKSLFQLGGRQTEAHIPQVGSTNSPDSFLTRKLPIA
jgi:hypothetical protein